ncbi:hypothetical protein QBC37DRAFT_400580 [Rhypophila decipiens]|uniref:Uncharacterized protein n=1 Tax=Rhypophila decipiens TaxID=261697 RepID=A0AAN6Y6J1_9PEZI|nr:hypothetical protein QBC37DRAFT_400580 [Rhypophila decipiens]
MPGADCNGFGGVIDGLLPLDPNQDPGNQTHNVKDFINWGQPLVPAMRQPDPVEAHTRQLEVVRATGENDTRLYDFQRRENEKDREVQYRQLSHERDMVRERMAQDAAKHGHAMEIMAARQEHFEARVKFAMDVMAAQHRHDMDIIAAREQDFKDRVKIVMDAIRSLGALGLIGLLVLGAFGLFGLLAWIGYLVGRQSGLY